MGDDQREGDAWIAPWHAVKRRPAAVVTAAPSLDPKRCPFRCRFDADITGHPGEVLLEEFLEPLGITQVELADRLDIPFQRVNQIVNEKRAVTPDTALRLSKLFGTSVDFWMNLQLACDLYEAAHSSAARSIQKIQTINTRELARV